MTPEHNNNKERQRRRRTQRQKAQKKQRRQIVLRLFLVLAAAVIAWAALKASDTQPTQSPTQAASTDTAAAEETETTASGGSATTIHIAVAGDLNVTDEILEDAATASGYDFTDAFLEAAPVLSAADLSILNFEGTLAGTPYGRETGSAPAQLAQALADIGVDVVQTANSASIRSGVLGLQSTIAGLQNVGIIPVGTFSNSEAFRRSGGFTLVEVEGIRIALVAFTKGMDNLGMPEGSEDCVNLLYEDYSTDYKKIADDAITDVLREAAAEEPDLTIALLHWGSEYNENISDSQEKICQLMQSNGVDAIIGTHSHLLQSVEYDREQGTLVAWSLGDFFGNASEAGSNYSAILDLEITLDKETGLTTISNVSATPIYTLKPEQSSTGTRRIVQLEKAIAAYEDGYIGRVSQDTYNSMTSAMQRVEKRLSGE